MITLITKILIATRIIHQKKYIRRLHSKLKIRFAKADRLGTLILCLVGLVRVNMH